MRYVGLDIHKDFCVACVMDDGGEGGREDRVPVHEGGTE
jgi:hypothetical protein